jgi:hypothetical protein
MRRPLIASPPNIQIPKSLDQRVCLGQANKTGQQSSRLSRVAQLRMVLRRSVFAILGHLPSYPKAEFKVLRLT